MNLFTRIDSPNIHSLTTSILFGIILEPPSNHLTGLTDCAFHSRSKYSNIEIQTHEFTHSTHTNPTHTNRIRSPDSSLRLPNCDRSRSSNLSTWLYQLQRNRSMCTDYFNERRRSRSARSGTMCFVMLFVFCYSLHCPKLVSCVRSPIFKSHHHPCKQPDLLIRSVLLFIRLIYPTQTVKPSNHQFEPSHYQCPVIFVLVLHFRCLHDILVHQNDRTKSHRIIVMN